MRNLLFSIEGLVLVDKKNAAIVGTCVKDEIRLGDNATAQVKRWSNGEAIMSQKILIQFRQLKDNGENTEVILPGGQATVIVPDCIAEQLKLGWYLEGKNA